MRLALRPLPLGLVVPAAAALVVLGTYASLDSGGTRPLLAALGLLGLGSFAYLAVWIHPGTFVAFGAALTVFSQYSDEMGLPISLDRVCMASGLLSLAIGLPGAVRDRVLVWRPVHAVLGLTAAYAIVSALAAGTLTETSGIFAILDRLGIMPFLAFLLAPMLFGTKERRDKLLAVLVGCGLYLGLTAVFEGIGATALLWPNYINDPAVGIHFGRARGPFAEAVANGLALYGCAVACAVAVVTWRTVRSRAFAGAVAVLCLAGTIFTLTRAVWLATVAATFLALLFHERTRRVLGPLVVTGFVALFIVFATVPGFSDAAEERTNSQRPLWDRYNTNRAAVNMIEDRPLFGVGWQRFRDESRDYFELSPNYPLTGAHIEVHNVFLSHAAELGIIGVSLWTLGLLLAMAAAIVRPGPADLDPWRLGTVALFAHWLIVASFGPLSYAFPNLLLWLWAGVAAMGHTSRPVAAPVRKPALADRR